MTHVSGRIRLSAGFHRFSQIFITSIAVMVAMFGISAQAQFRASIQGTVTDPSGALIPHASLARTDTSNNHTHSAKSNAQGIYHFEALPADTFQLVVNAAGFASKTLTGGTVIPAQPNTLNLKLGA